MRRPPTNERPKRNEPRVNHRIRIREVRVIGPEGDQLGIMLTEDALHRAQDSGLDLVEISPTARPPVCKIMDYGRFKYLSKKKAGEQRKNQKTIEVKEVKFRPKTDFHDINVKLGHARRFLGEGNKVKVTIMFRGREITHPEIGQQLLERVAAELKDVGNVEFFPRMEGRTMFMIIAPVKTGARSSPKVGGTPKSRERAPVSRPAEEPVKEPEQPAVSGEATQS